MNSFLWQNLYFQVVSHPKAEFGLFFDIDGVIVRGRELLPGAKEAFRLLLDNAKKFWIPTIFVTNAGNCLRQKKASQLSDWLGVEVSSFKGPGFCDFSESLVSCFPFAIRPQVNWCSLHLLQSNQSKFQIMAWAWHAHGPSVRLVYHLIHLNNHRWRMSKWLCHIVPCASLTTCSTNMSWFLAKAQCMTSRGGSASKTWPQ